ncbi:MAG: DNA primase [Gemmatimonadota bacterium]|nr:DNA primase [Gemmatimonadota bacterium]
MVRDAQVEEVRERADIVELLGEHTTLRRAGRTWRGPCPLHGGEGPNFSVDPSRGLYKCFVCGEGGDVFAFFMKHLGLDFPTALRHVAARSGVTLPERGEERPDPFAPLREVVAFAEEWFLERRRDEVDGRQVRRYLEGREITLSEADAFRLGWAPDAWRDLRDAAHGRGIDDDLLLEAGLLATSERAEEPYDRFRARLIFPIHDLRDRPIAFGGRVLGPAGEHAPKYINSPESPIFHKGETLYGLSRARHEIRREEAALVCEGYMDVLALHGAGLRTAVAPLGTALTEDQAGLLRRYAPKAYLLYDSDTAGLRATFRSGDALLAAGVHPMVVTFPAGEDPDSFVRGRGIDALHALLADAVDLLERKLIEIERRGLLGTVEGRRRAVDGLLSTLRAVRDPALRDLYLGLAAERTGVRRETLVGEVAREPRPAAGLRVDRGHGRPAAGASSRTSGSAGPSRGADEPGGDAAGERLERELVLLMVRDSALRNLAAEKGLEARHLRHEALREIFVALGAGDPDEGVAGVAGRLPAAHRSTLEELAGDEAEFPDPGRAFEQGLRRLLNRERLERLDRIDRELELADEAQARELLGEKSRIVRALRSDGVRLSFLRRYATGRNGSPDSGVATATDASPPHRE